MRLKKDAAMVLAALSTYAPSWAGVTASEAAQLGKTLTPMGAMAAANPQGRIPAYNGGMTKPPAGWRKDGPWVNPYNDEKPIQRIDATNVDQSAEKLSDGLVFLLKNKPGFYINVYKTHRDYAFPKFVQDGTTKNATNPECKTEDDGLALAKACRGGYPFPIPKTGYEVMWNKLINYSPVTRGSTTNWLVDSNGNQIVVSVLNAYRDNFNYFGGSLPRANTDAIYNIFASVVGPARLSGSAQGQMDFLAPLKTAPRTWHYSPGQRRVRMAPEFAYDTPHATLGGGILYDEVYLFIGAMDRFDFKLLGRKEAFIPANNYDLTMLTDPLKCGPPKVMHKTHVNPECMRFELRRVWEVEATLKEGKRHLYSKRRWLLDEDSYTVGTYDAYDQAGQLARTGQGFAAQSYDPDNLGVYSPGFVMYDLKKSMYVLISAPNKPPVFGDPMREVDTQPEAVAARSVR